MAEAEAEGGDGAAGGTACSAAENAAVVSSDGAALP